MRVLTNAIPMTGLLTGIGRYARSLYAALEAISGCRVSYFAGPRTLERMPDPADPCHWIAATSLVWRLPDPVVVALRSAYLGLREWQLRRQVTRGSYDVYHETGFIAPVLRQVPVVYTIYDLSLLTFRHTHPRERVMFFDLFFRRRLPAASHVITISEYVRGELLEHLGLRPEQVTAIPLAQAPQFSRRPPDQVRKELAQRGLPSEYLLFVGSLEPRKNLSLLMQALSLCESRPHVVVAGWQGWGDKAWMERLETLGIRDRVHMVGYIDDESLARLYSGALAFVYPSLYEGFGLPILEAMACHCPVLGSTAGSLPEVSGGAALLVAPDDAPGLARAMDAVVGDPKLRERLRLDGLARASQFSWERTARETLDVFQQVVGYC